METRSSIKKKATEKAKKRQAKRTASAFNRVNNVIAPNDMIVNIACNKIKIEVDDDDEQVTVPEVKQETDNQNEECSSKTVVVETTTKKMKLNTEDTLPPATPTLDIGVLIKHENDETVDFECTTGKWAAADSIETAQEIWMKTEGEDNEPLEIKILSYGNGEYIQPKSSLFPATSTDIGSSSSQLFAPLKEPSQTDTVTVPDETDKPIPSAASQDKGVFEQTLLINKDIELLIDPTVSVESYVDWCKTNNINISEPVTHVKKTTEFGDGLIDNTQPGTFASTSRTCDTEDRRVLTLFDPVVKIVTTRGRRTAHGDGIRSTYWSLLKTCRLVCKTWKSSADDVMANHASHLCLRRLSPEINEPHFLSAKLFTSYPKMCRTRLTPVAWKTSRFVHSLLDIQEKDPSYNPFPSRHLMADYKCCNDLWGNRSHIGWESFAEIISLCLAAFGLQILHFTVRVKDYCLEFAEIGPAYNSIMEWLQMLPNLKSLSIIFDETDGIWNLEDNYIKEQIITESKLVPHMKNLVAFQCEGNGKLSVAVANSVLKNNRQVVNIFLDLDHPLNNIKLAKLTELTLRASRINSLNQVSGLDVQSCKLKKVTAYFTCGFYFNKHIMPLLSDFKSSLQFLTLQLNHGKFYATPVLDFPNVRYLHIIYYDWSFISWGENLKKMQSLEVLKLELQPNTRHLYKSPLFLAKITDRLTFWNFVNSFHQQMCWHEFKNLTSVHFTVLYKQCRNVGKKFFFVQKLSNMLPVRFEIIKIGKNEKYAVESSEDEEINFPLDLKRKEQDHIHDHNKNERGSERYKNNIFEAPKLIFGWDVCGN